MIYPSWTSTNNVYPDWIGVIGSIVAIEYLVTMFDPLSLKTSFSDCLLLLCVISDPLKLSLDSSLSLDIIAGISNPLELKVLFSNPLDIKVDFEKDPL